MIEVGLTYSQQITVKHSDTAAVYGSGKLEVFATPAMIGLIENTAIKCLEGHLEEGSDTVGIEINAKHIKATPVGKNVSCKVCITEINGRSIKFSAEAWDDNGTIGTATHERFIINPEKFMAKLK